MEVTSSEKSGFDEGKDKKKTNSEAFAIIQLRDDSGLEQSESNGSEQKHIYFSYILKTKRILCGSLTYIRV